MYYIYVTVIYSSLLCHYILFSVFVYFQWVWIYRLFSVYKPNRKWLKIKTLSMFVSFQIKNYLFCLYYIPFHLLLSLVRMYETSMILLLFPKFCIIIVLHNMYVVFAYVWVSMYIQLACNYKLQTRFLFFFPFTLTNSHS